jgi:hypothetical protein
MAIIISKKGLKATKIDPSQFPQENSLQEYIFQNPETIPIYDIREDIKLLILAREFSTSSGPIDALGIDNAGDIYLIETKLFRNADKRLVVAQVLDYGAALWREMRDYQQFVNQINDALHKCEQPDFSERIQQYFGLTDEERDQLLQQMQRNFQDGSFKFVVLMDTLHEQLKNLILFLNQNSEFDVYAVELKYYKYDSFEIVIPKLFGSEVKKDLTQKTKLALPTDDDFLNAYAKQGQQKEAQVFLDVFHDLNEGRLTLDGVSAHKTPKTCTITVRQNNGKTTFSLYVDPMFEGGGIDVWTYGNSAWTRAYKVVTDSIPSLRPTAALANQNYARMGRWALKHFSRKSFEMILRDLTSV